MIMRSVYGLLLTLALLGVGPFARACDASGEKVTAVLGAQVATYDDKGDYVADIAKASIKLDEPVVACRDSPALIKVKLADNHTAWVDRLDVKVTGGKDAGPRACKNRGVSHESDTKAPAVSGIDPCSR
jgi:hypothetical protein